jgi:hypothetical protein
MWGGVCCLVVAYVSLQMYTLAEVIRLYLGNPRLHFEPLWPPQKAKKCWIMSNAKYAKPFFEFFIECECFYVVNFN